MRANACLVAVLSFISNAGSALSVYAPDSGLNEVREYDSVSGELLHSFPVVRATDAAVGPDGSLYVASQDISQSDAAEIIKIDLASGP